MDAEQLKYRIAFAAIRGMGIELAQRMLEILPNEETFFTAETAQLAQLLQTNNKIIDASYRHRTLQMAEEELKFIHDNGIETTYFTDDDFPARLLNAPDAPVMLYGKGRCNLNSNKMISIVGTRNATSYGTQFCERLIADIADAFHGEVVIVSGLAYGIDIAAHRAALRNGIPTVAVLAHGLGTIYPAIHRSTAIEMINKGGALLTDYTSHASVSRANFLARNRIVAALSDCTIIVESAEKGGAMVTARIASSYNRDVFALPGRATDKYSSGCNQLIRRNAAALITSCNDLADAMQWEMKTDSAKHGTQRSLFPTLSPEEQAVYDYLKAQNGEPVHINAIYTALKTPMSQLLGLLIELEFKGIVLPAAGNKYSAL